MSRGFFKKSETYKSKRAYATMNGVNLSETYGMKMTSFRVGTPTPLLKLIDVPGRPGKLDATLALNGKVNYSVRKVSAEFHIRSSTYEELQTMFSKLLAAFNGTESKISFSTDPNWYYKGRFSVAYKKTNPITATITISCSDVFPYKLEETIVEQSISSSGYVYCTGQEYNGAPTIYVSTAMSLTFKGTTYQLKAGNNKLREIHFSKGSNSLRFVGTGNVKITYERGIL